MITLLTSHELQVCKNCFCSSIHIYLESWFSFLNASLDPQVKGSFSRGHRVFQLSRGIDGWFAFSVPACRANYWWAFFSFLFFFFQIITCLNRSICFFCVWCYLGHFSTFPLNRTFKPEVSCWLPRLPVQVAGLTLLRVQLGRWCFDCQKVPEMYRWLHEQTPVKDHSIQRLQGTLLLFLFFFTVSIVIGWMSKIIVNLMGHFLSNKYTGTDILAKRCPCTPWSNGTVYFTVSPL